MGPIQSSVNQMLGTATIGAGLFAQSPVGKRMAELKQLNLQEKAIIAQRQTVTKRADLEATHGEPLSETEVSALLSAGDKETEIYKKRFELQPTVKNLSKYEEVAKLNAAASTPQEMAAERAEESMQAERARIQAQKELMNKPRIYDAHGNDVYGRK